MAGCAALYPPYKRVDWRITDEIPNIATITGYLFGKAELGWRGRGGLFGFALTSVKQPGNSERTASDNSEHQFEESRVSAAGNGLAGCYFKALSANNSGPPTNPCFAA
jgi:hypothetical protein